jgi:hypothetical protein
MFRAKNTFMQHYPTGEFKPLVFSRRKGVVTHTYPPKKNV